MTDYDFLDNPNHRFHPCLTLICVIDYSIGQPKGICSY